MRNGDQFLLKEKKVILSQSETSCFRMKKRKKTGQENQRRSVEGESWEKNFIHGQANIKMNLN